MIIVDGEALGSILHSALTKTGKPMKSAEKQSGVTSAEAIASAAVPQPEPLPSESHGSAASVTTADTGVRQQHSRKRGESS
jgi:hypothetical protein